MKNTKNSGTDSDISSFCSKKIAYYEELITTTINAINIYKQHEIYGTTELYICIKGLEEIYDNICKLKCTLDTQGLEQDDVIKELQNINNYLFSIFKSYGTYNVNDVLYVTFGNEYLKTLKEKSDKPLIDMIMEHVRPISFVIVPWKKNTRSKSEPKKRRLAKNRIVEDFSIVETSETLECFDLARTSRNFITKVHGIKITFNNEKERKTLILSGLVDDLLMSCFDHEYLQNKTKSVYDNRPNEPDFNTDDFEEFMKSLTLKELLVYNNDELYNRYIGYLNQISLIKQKPISQVVKEFLNSELYGQRKTLIQILLKRNNSEYQYLAYLLYDLLSNDNNNLVDTKEQNQLYDSLPWSIRKLFHSAMKSTVNYTKSLSNFDNSKIPLEQQICLLKADDNVKEKAMIKLKEVKAKSEDSGSKARQYLEGILKIPFGIYKSEPILSVMKTCKKDFIQLVKSINCDYSMENIPVKDNYTSLEVSKYLKEIKNNNMNHIQNDYITKVTKTLLNGKRNDLISNICRLNTIIKGNNMKISKLTHSGKKSSFMKDQMKKFIETNKDNGLLMSSIHKSFNIKQKTDNIKLQKEITLIDDKWLNVQKTMQDIRSVLDDAVYGHSNAKRNIERVIGQWMNGELKGYCFGFEGPPGVGKTSMAKNGIAKCLTDEEGNNRPFGFIPIGGSSNGSILDGHNYTYVGSTWGRIVDVLMESKCMNPIIFIDELDKVSRTEHGKEIIGILTHLVDPTQNEEFQDKYFNGINLDLSKALFIFSYNDVELIDRILLDRIHRVEFKPLKLKEKKIITRNHLLPEIYQRLGLNSDVVQIGDEVIEFIVEKFTYESGVRKLKEILYEVISEMNLEILKNEFDSCELPLVVTIEQLKKKYLKEYNEIKPKTIHSEHEVGIINGLWANSYGKGGIIPIQTQLFPTSGFLELKLTGMQGDVMKESMNVAKTLAFKLTSPRRQKALVKKFKETNMQGIHIHCPEGAVPKDGPSAGTAITTAIYSLLNDKKIKNTIAITGEITLMGNVTAIGGLDLKILGGIAAGIKEFIYPTENNEDFRRFMDKNKDNPVVEGITFHAVDHIDEVFKLVFV